MKYEKWHEDKYVRCLKDRINDYDLFSFDIFDTLLFRHCERPVDVFVKV